MFWQFLRIAAAVLAFLCSLPALAEPDLHAPTPAELMAPPAIDSPILSPDGRTVVARALVDGRARLALFDVGRPGAGPVPVALPEAERLEWYRWLGEGRLLVSLLRQGPSPMVRLVSIDMASGAQAQLGPMRPAAHGDEVIHVDRGGAFLLLQSQAGEQRTPAVYRIDLATGRATLAVAAEPHVWDWIADSAGVVRAGMAAKGPQSWLLYRKDAADRFSRSGRGAGDPGSGIEQFVPVRGSDQGYAMAQTRAGRVGLFRYDFRRSRLGALVYENPAADLDGFQTGPDGQLLGVSYTAGREEMLWFDSALAREQAAMDAALPGRVNRVVSASADKRKLLVFSRSARDPGAFYVFGEGRAQLLSSVNQMLYQRRLSDVRSVRYRARDGLEISGFLTLPAGRDSRLPLVVMPHGGPFARDEWGYDPWVQYLAGRGYAVLQPAFRGSTGRGRAFVERGDGEWGRGMQDDLDDGVAWLAQQGIADPGRVCIMGASFGGYAAMWAGVRDPGRYRCAISFAGISDVQAQLDYDRRTFAERDYRAWKARIQGKAASLDSLSPLRRVERLTTPILIAHGSEDETVPPEQSVKLHAALVRLGRPHEYVTYQGEGHTLADPANTVDFLTRVGKFLDAHNPS